MDLGRDIRERRESMSLAQGQVAAGAHISKPYLSSIETGKSGNPPSDGVLRRLESVLAFEPGELTKWAHLARTPVDIREDLERREAEVHKLKGVVRDLLRGSPEKLAPQRPGECDLTVIAGDENVRVVSPGVVVPVINSVAAGYPHDFTDLDYPPSVADEYIRCPEVRDAQAFAARVVGDSMEPDYREGDIVIFSPQTPAESGDDCFVRFDADGGTTFKRFYLDDDDRIRLQPLNSRYPAQTYPREAVTGLWPAIFRVQRLRGT